MSHLTYQKQGANEEVIHNPACLNTLIWVQLASHHQLERDDRGTRDIGEYESQTYGDSWFCIIYRPPDEATKTLASCWTSEWNYTRDDGQEQNTNDSN